jgi:nucleoside-diphosphate-sugar epimerase
MRILVTGVSGFVGRALLERLSKAGGHELRGAVRRADAPRDVNAEYVTVSDLSRDTDWSRALMGCDVVVHAAARVHVLRDTAADPLAEFRRVNVDGTLNLARQALTAGVRRFVFVSSIKVNGEETPAGRPFRADDAPQPRDAYGLSKLEAEQGLRVLYTQPRREWVVVRPTLVYGPGVKANFLKMMQWLDRGVPLPLGAIRNSRSFTAIDNLASLLEQCAVHPAAANEVFLAADGEDLSTTELLRRLARRLGKRARLLPIPPAALQAAARLLGRGDFARRLLGNLQVDVGKARERLRWSPAVSVDEALERTVRAFLASRPT